MIPWDPLLNAPNASCEAAGEWVMSSFSADNAGARNGSFVFEDWELALCLQLTNLSASRGTRF